MSGLKIYSTQDSEIQKYIYSAYTSDAENIRKSFRVKVDVFNIICLVYC